MRVVLSKKWTLFIIALPFLLLFTLFHYVPLFGWLYAFFDFKPGIPLFKSDFAGFKYFAMALDLAKGSELLISIRNTLIFSFLNILVSPLAPLFAIFLLEMGNRTYRKVVQTVTTLPHFISWILVYSIFFTFFSMDDGFVNKMLLGIGIIKQPLNVLANSNIVYWFQTTIDIWKGTGWGAIIYIAAITSIGPELYDAAAIDGAGRLAKIWHITVPGIIPTFAVLMLLRVSNILSTGFDQYYVFYNAMVHDKIQVLDYYIYRIGIGLGDFPFATAISIFRTVINVTLLFTANLFIKKIRGFGII